MVRSMISSKVVIDRVKSTFQIGHSNWINFAVNELGWGIQLIGYHTGFKEVTIPICVVNNLASYPSVLVGFKGIIYKGRRLPLGEDKSMSKLANQIKDRKHKMIIKDEEAAMEIERLITAYNNLVEYELKNNVVEEERKEELLDKIKELKLSFGLSSNDMDVNQYHYYSVTDNQIITTFESGDIEVIGTTISVDEEGYPMIRNEANYVEACVWWVTQKLMLQGYKNPVMGYGDALSMWENYKGKASNNAKISVDKMENFKNMWTRYVHKTNFADDFFSGAELQSQI